MEAFNQQIPMLSIPLKVTEETDFTSAFKSYIMEHYQEDPENYLNEISILNRLRQDITGVGKDMTGRDILYRYYGQLELLDLRFPLDEKHVKVPFTWYDAFTGEGVRQYSGAYEKACVIFNIAAILSAIAATQNRFEEEGKKIAYNYFQASAGLFQFINDNFLHAPSVDIQRESVKCLNKLMLASAQECFLEKTIFEKKKPNLLSKIASYLTFIYSEISDDMNVMELRDQFDDSWISLVKVKSKYYATISNYYKALACADEGKYGHIISYLTLAENYAKDANKLAKSFASNYPSFSVSSSDSQSASTGNSTSASQSLFEATKAYLALVTDKKKQAIKDNDIVYQEIVPNADTLEAPEKLCVVKNLNFVDICPNGKKEAQGIIGQDVFHRLIPIQVHEASSLYSEEKAKILREEVDRCDIEDSNFQSLMQSQDIVNTINKAKDALKNEGINENMVSFPEEIATFCNLVQQEVKIGKTITSTIASLNTLQMKAHENLNNIGLELDKEQREYDIKLQIYNTKWTQESSITSSSNIRQNLKKYRASLEEAITADNAIITKYNANKKYIDALEQPVEKVKADYIKSIIESDSKEEQTVNLIDVNMDDVLDKKKNELEKINNIEALIMNLKGCQGERKKLIEELRYKIQNDDINSILLVKKHKEKQVFQTELAKFQGIRDNISRNIEDNNKFLNDLTEGFNKLKNESEIFKSVDTFNAKKEQKNKEFRDAFELWKDIYKNLDSGIQCYTNLNNAIDNLKIDTNNYVSQRLTQRNNLEKKVKEEKAADDQKILLDKLNSLNLSNSNVPSSATPYTPSVPSNKLQSPTTNYYASPTVTSPQSYSYINTATAPVAAIQSPTNIQRNSLVLNESAQAPSLSLVSSPTQASAAYVPQQQQQQQQQQPSIPLYQQPASTITQQAPVAQYNYQQPVTQTQPISAYSAYQQQPQQPQTLNLQNQTALKLQQALISPPPQTQPQPQVQASIPTQNTYSSQQQQQQQQQQQPLYPTQQSSYSLPSVTTPQSVTYPSYQTTSTAPAATPYQKQPSFNQTSNSQAYVPTMYATQTQPQAQTIGRPSTYPIYQQNTYDMYKPQPQSVNTTAPAIPPKPTTTQDPISASITSPVRPPLPPPPGSVSFTQSSTTSLYGQTQQPQQQAPYVNYYAQAATTTSHQAAAPATTTNVYVNPYGQQPQQRAVPQTPIQPAYYGQQPQQPLYTTQNTTTGYTYQQQPTQAQNPYYQQQANPAYYSQTTTATTPQTNYYQQQQQQQQQQTQDIAQVNSIQNQQLASLSQYKPLKPQQYNQPSLLD
ncbi:BRO1-domain-containing protein [Piromyces finnis]|uniref:BRO domain-containing protein 1 n=1 Tax=Piromyces finnis TaxID=1754191 RepID=A0A1Y1V3L5_9FUNG|nr:BRO1-domain-containing protein [Piromyces finnis]|eukprot:ORX45928.1 BRO1-domain-containing protein [Piromyces finnis]